MKSYPSFIVLQLKFNFSLTVNGILSAEIFGSVNDFMALTFKHDCPVLLASLQFDFLVQNLFETNPETLTY